MQSGRRLEIHLTHKRLDKFLNFTELTRLGTKAPLIGGDPVARAAAVGRKVRASFFQSVCSVLVHGRFYCFALSCVASCVAIGANKMIMKREKRNICR